MRRLRITLLFALAFFATAARAQVNPDWTTQLPPFQIADHLYYVGSRDLASYLITTPAGNILLNANLDTSPPQIRASIEKLGFHYADTKILLNGQAHFDHMAGAAQVLRETHALNEVMDGDVEAVTSGGRTGFNLGPAYEYTPTHVDRVLQDGDAITLGGITLIAHKTPGHTQGCTTFTLRVHLPGEPTNKLRDVVILGGITALSSYQLIDKPGHPASYPGIATDFQQTFATLRSLPCDIFLGAHGGYFNLLEKLKRLPTEGPSVFIDPQGYKETIHDAEYDFKKQLAKQEAAN